MDFQVLIKTDLNLLVTLYVLFEERSVSRSAERLFITQSAVSKALSRLRERFGDPLFTRSGHQLVPTPFLESRAALLFSTLNDISRLFTTQTFIPRISHGDVKVTFPEMIDLVVTPRLLAYLRTNAPGIKISAEHYGDDVLERLANGGVDFAISMEYSHYPDEFRTIPFLNSSPAVVARKGHPLTQRNPSYQHMIEYPRITVKLPDQSMTDFYKTFMSSQRETSDWPSYYDTESMLSALSIIRMTDYLLPVPDFVARLLISTTDLQKFRFTSYSEDVFNYVIVFHQRVADSPMHIWFSQVLQKMGQEISAEKRLDNEG